LLIVLSSLYSQRLTVRLCGGRGNMKTNLQIENCPSGHPQQPRVIA
jgi:hypothetical protein